jgi:hypothetical protein
MAAALGFGILFATGILMMLVPAFTAIQLNIMAWLGKAVGGEPEDPELEAAIVAPAGD